MKFVLTILAVFSTAFICAAADLPRSTPEAQGVSSAGILAFVEAVDQNVDSLQSFMLVRHGKVIAEGWWAPHRADTKHMQFSLSKSFTSTAVGLAIADGKLNVDDPVLNLFADEAPPEPSENLKKMRVSDLLRMATGHQTEPPRTDDVSWVKSFLSHPVPFKPGTHFLYNTPATYMQSAIVQKVTGSTVLDYLKPRLFDPLGINDPTWEASPQGVSAGGFGLNICTEDIAKFGQLYLQKGMWEGKQLVPESWVAASTSVQISTGSNPVSDSEQGYGYQWWRCRHNGYRAAGAFGQHCLVLPEYDAVIAITSAVKDSQHTINMVWDLLLPAMKASPMAADDESWKKLEKTLASLSLRAVSGDQLPANLLGKKFVFPPNEQKLEAIRIEAGQKPDASESSAVVVIRTAGIEHRIDCGRSHWVAGKTEWNSRGPRSLGTHRESPIAASGAWTSGDTFISKICFYETPFTVTVSLKFSGDEVVYHAVPNVAFDPKVHLPLIGIAGENLPRLSQVPTIDSKLSQSSATKPDTQPANLSDTTTHDFVKWEKAIEAFEAADKIKMPETGGILFVGSSTIVLWKSLAEDFAGYNVINRGFGGSEIVDSTYYAERMILPYEPKQIFLRAGGNDLHAGRLPEEVATDFVKFVNKIHSHLPKTEIYFIAVSPAPSRWGETDKMRELNNLIRKWAINLPRVGFVDAFDITLDSSGQARPELFVPDMLHLNADGYKLLTARVRPFLPTKP